MASKRVFFFFVLIIFSSIAVLSADVSAQTCLCTPGETRPCGKTLGECERGMSICTSDCMWGPCEGGGGAEPFEICGNDRDDNCDGKPDEYDLQCKACSNSKQDVFERGIDCGGPCETQCFDVPWLIVFAAAGVLVVLILFVVYPSMVRREKESQKTQTL